MSELIIKEIPIKHRKEQAFLSFSMQLKNGRNKKYCGVGVFQVLNPDHEYYGQWTISSYFLKPSFIEFFDTKEEAIERATQLLKKMKSEYKSGIRNWWTGKILEKSE